ncbi:MAG: NAD-dependent malic enzyme [Alphaproteobacteria bacterium]|nr:NAD-dependent malic enzyme [Alphaproteobacteria bacterium]MDE2336740.1 NAD-dependent malic enzyme [Alphaproteobacteria bacterium]
MKHRFNRLSAPFQHPWPAVLRAVRKKRAVSQAAREQAVLDRLRQKKSDIEKYLYLSVLQARDEKLFYAVALHHVEEIMPLIYTPAVGEACLKFSHIFREPQGLTITPADKGEIRRKLDQWPEKDVRSIVVTDGERILGLGDLGANGLGIPVGKLALYTLCGGLDPRKSLPVMFDVGTNNAELLQDPLYGGVRQKRLQGKEYFELMREFVAAINDKYPKALLQFEDFFGDNAYKLLEEYRDKTLCFNDDIQGTAAVVLAGVYAALRITQEELKDQRFVFLGAGTANIGIADLVVKALEEAGLTNEEARGRIWLVDRGGLVTEDSPNLTPQKKIYAKKHAPMGFLETIREVKPQTLVGATGKSGAFTREIIAEMAKLNGRPLVFALSNPTAQAECTAEQAYEWSGGKALFATGSPFAPVARSGQTFRPGQANNAYIFPGVALGALSCEASRVTGEMFLAAAKALAAEVTQGDLDAGTLYPPLKDIRAASAKIAAAVMKTAAAQKLNGRPLPKDIPAFLTKVMYDPDAPARRAGPSAANQNKKPRPDL